MHSSLCITVAALPGSAGPRAPRRARSQCRSTPAACARRRLGKGRSTPRESRSTRGCCSPWRRGSRRARPRPPPRWPHCVRRRSPGWPARRNPLPDRLQPYAYVRPHEALKHALEELVALSQSTHALRPVLEQGTRLWGDDVDGGAALEGVDVIGHMRAGGREAVEPVDSRGQDRHGVGPAQVVEEVHALHLDRDPVPQRTDAAGVDLVPVEVAP